MQPRPQQTGLGHAAGMPDGGRARERKDARSEGNGGRALALGPRRRPAVLAGAGVIAFAVALVLALEIPGAGAGAGPAGKGASHTAKSSRYGGLPSWLPKAKAPVNRVLDASAAHPALAIQGNAVSVQLAHWRVLATAVGPETPEQGKFPVPATTPVSFVVTFASATGTVPIAASAFTLVDEEGHVRHPRVTAMDGGPPPPAIEPGRPRSIVLKDVIPTGDGGLEWTPDGRRPTVAWDYDVEID